MAHIPSALFLAAAAIPFATLAARPISPPDFGPNVLVLDPSMTDIQPKLDRIFAEQERGQFNSNRHAILFKPGKYTLDVQVGFYTQVAGLGRSPGDVTITGAVRSKARWMKNNNATCNFWRCVENLSVVPTIEGNVNVWAVSQASALRRVHIKGDLHLSDGGWSSGGFIADTVIDGAVNSGSQQQWFSRNTDWARWNGGNWNMVFVGTTNPPTGSWPASPYTVIDQTPIIREKPYLFVDDAGAFSVMVPDLDRDGSRGTTWESSPTPGTPIPIDEFLVARPDVHDVAAINAALAAGKHVLFTPGIYRFKDAIQITRPNTVVLGLGYPTIMADAGNIAMTIADVPGVRVGVILLDAGTQESPTLLQVGEPGSSISHADNPIFLYDLFCRAGGAAVGVTRSFVVINSSNVVGDNFWLWRADHGAGSDWNENRNANGLTVNGNDVTLYALFVEHSQEYQTIWNGERGRVYFYQSEMPYDPPSQDAWSHEGVRGFASYKVADHVATHDAWGLGVYCVFTDATVVADTAIEAPTTPGVKLRHLITVRLNGLPGTGINHVLNKTGTAVLTPAAKISRLD
jgi:hypothetical protein